MILPKSKYKNVLAHFSHGKYIGWTGQLTTNGKLQRKYHKDEKQAAKWVDVQLIRQGKDPVNILKKC